MSCIFCDERRSFAFYNFQTTFTKYTLTPINIYCEQILGNALKIDNNMSDLICHCCFESFNELDMLEKKVRQLIQDLKLRHIAKRKSEHLKQELRTSENETEDYSLDFREDDHDICTQEKKPDKIHFADETDLKNILSDKFNMKEEIFSNDEMSIKVDEEVNVLYDMMDEKNFEIIIEQKKEERSRKQLCCRKCTEVFETSQELKAHVAEHAKNLSYTCEICRKSYRHKTALDIHIGMHNGINPFKCLYCDKTFTQKGALIRHVKIHTGEKPYQCEKCGKCFTHHTSFNIHKLSHTGEKSFKCEVCGLGLISTSHLKRHMRVHTGEKRYICSTCGKRFAERYNLASHSKLHSVGAMPSPKMKFKCEICGKMLKKRLDLEEHMMKEHYESNVNEYMLYS